MDVMNYIEHITENPLYWSDIKSNTTMDFMEFMDYMGNAENNNTQTTTTITTTISIELQECYEESYINYNAKEDDENVV